jgi:lysophospholipase L1-like esterase
MKKPRLFSIKTLFFCSGWLVAIALACMVLPRAAHKLLLKLPSYQREEWARTMNEKKRDLSVPWKDARPLIIFAGDSQIEMGNWYAVFGGTLAVRNCGLSRAEIKDVTELVSAIGDRHVKKVVLMCGINNLGKHEAVQPCLADYEQLLATVRSTLAPEKIIVLSVMPVRESLVDEAARQLNGQVRDFNRGLAELCRRSNAQFVDVTAAIGDSRGSLRPELTSDGLHLNSSGYRAIGDTVAVALAKSE